MVAPESDKQRSCELRTAKEGRSSNNILSGAREGVLFVFLHQHTCIFL